MTSLLIDFNINNKNFRQARQESMGKLSLACPGILCTWKIMRYLIAWKLLLMISNTIIDSDDTDIYLFINEFIS